MKTLFAVCVRFMNGTVTMGQDGSTFADEELANKVADALREKNKGLRTIIEVIPITHYENENEVPILNDEKDS
jgi:hypothetical protein